jgi:hypothetical protein
VTDTGALPDWRRSRVGDPLPCGLCARPAILRHPATGKPMHKVCHDARAQPETTSSRDARSRQTITERRAA